MYWSDGEDDEDRLEDLQLDVDVPPGDRLQLLDERRDLGLWDERRWEEEAVRT